MLLLAVFALNPRDEKYIHMSLSVYVTTFDDKVSPVSEILKLHGHPGHPIDAATCYS